MNEYAHIQIEREAKTGFYRGRPNPNAQKPPSRDKKAHGEIIKMQLESATDRVLESRSNYGIQTDKLMVFEITSDSLPHEVLELLLSNFRLCLVEELSAYGSNISKLVVQFDDSNAIREFDNERLLWQNDSQEKGVLTYAKRRDLFNSIENVRALSREDRIGTKLRNFMDNNVPTDSFFVINFDVWYNNTPKSIPIIRGQLSKVLGTTGSKLLGDLFEIPCLLLGRAKVNTFSLQALLDMDIISSVELPLESIAPEPCAPYSINHNFVLNNTLGNNAPLATILDSGVFSANPLLRAVVVAEEDFDLVENTPIDYNGHGTAVAGIVVYGNFDIKHDNTIVNPLVKVCSAKIMHDINGETCFRIDVRPEQIVKEAITFFYKTYGCRIFNLSAGDDSHLYDGGRQFSWASMLDNLSRDLDIVIIVSAGNVNSPEIQDFTSRTDLMEKTRNQLFDVEHRLIDPATAALCITVGSIARCSEPAIPWNPLATINPISVGDKDYPSAFTRIGFGVHRAIKPDFVDYGGNFAVRQIIHGKTNWLKKDINLMEPTLSNKVDKLFAGYCGTSFSAAHVTHMAARLERSLEEQLNSKPSANLIRAMLANSASLPGKIQEWGMSSVDKEYKGNDNPKRERLMRLTGYGKVSDKVLNSSDSTVTLFAEDELLLRSFHLYKIPVPRRFASIRSSKSISISLAYNPVTRISRKDYLAANLWFEVFRRIDEDTLIKYKAKLENSDDLDDDYRVLPDEYKISSFKPGYESVRWSTLQQRRWEKGTRGGSDILWPEHEDPYIYILVSGKERFKFEEQFEPQSYALCITFSYDSDEDINLYNQLYNSVRLKVSERVKTRVKL